MRAGRAEGVLHWVELLECRRLLAGEAVTQFLLINADTDQTIGALSNGEIINFQALGTNHLNVVAQTVGATQSVRFALDSNSNYRTENSAPFSLSGDSGGDFRSWTPSLGSHTLKATPFTLDSAGGTAGTALQIGFQVIDQPVGNPAVLQASQASLDFGDVRAGTMESLDVTITNTSPAGGSLATILGTNISGSSAFSDSFNDATDVILAPGESGTVTVRFSPQTSGPLSGTLSIQHTGASSPLQVALAGNGTLANRPPVLAPIGNKTVAPGAMLTAPISATDPDGNAIDLRASNLPSFATFKDNGTGSGSLVIAPAAGTSGTFTGVTITATDSGSPAMSDSESFSITVTASGGLTLTLINADTDEPIGQLVDGFVINYGLIGTDRINILANAPSGTQSVRFGYDSNNSFRTENSEPYAMNGDSSGNFAAWTPSVGAHVIKATAYTGDNAGGTAGPTLIINVTVVEGSDLLASPGSVSFSAAQNGTATPKNVTISTSDGSGASYTATSNATWLSVSPASGNTSQPLVLSINSATLPLGTHQAYVTVKSPTHGPVKIPVTLDITGTFVADQIHLSFVQNPATTLTVVWRTMSTSTPSTVEYRALGSGTWLSATGAQRTSGTSGKLHETTLTGLTSATTYEYRVRGDSSAWSPVFTTRTMPALGPADFEAIYFGDTGLIGRLDGLDTGTAQAIAEIKKLDPELVLGGGDYAYYNTDTRFGTLNNTIDQWFKQNAPVFSRSPIMPTYGNHEVLLGESLDAWKQRFATPSGWNSGRNFSFDIGEAHFISILAEQNSTGISSSSLTWVTNDLAAARAAGKKWIVPYYHVSPFADGSSHPSNLALRAQLGPIFEQYGVKVALASHDQSYERTYPLRNVPSNITRTDTSLSGYDINDGVTWVKVSPAGKLSNHGGVNDFSKFTTNPKPSYIAYRDDTMHHFSRLVFRANGTLRVETYGFSGDGTPAVIIDSFEYNLGSSADTAGAAQQTAVAKLIASRANGWTWSLADPITFDSLTGGELDAEMAST